MSAIDDLIKQYVHDSYSYADEDTEKMISDARAELASLREKDANTDTIIHAAVIAAVKAEQEALLDIAEKEHRNWYESTSKRIRSNPNLRCDYEAGATRACENIAKSIRARRSA